jgi:hypothetical protein
LLLLLVSFALPLMAQGVTVTTTGGSLRVRAPRLLLIDGDVLERLKAGRAVDVDFALSVLGAPGGRVMAETRQRFRVSYDLWEERFAATRLGTPPRSVSHLTARDVETWCLDNLAIPRTTLEKAIPPGGRFWVKVEHTAVDDAPGTPSEEGRFTLRTLVEILSRTPRTASPARALEAGPFGLSD